jgi:hypothetical protein
LKSRCPVFGGLAPVLFLLAASAASGETPGAAAPVRPENPLVGDIVARMEQSGRAEPDPVRRRAIFQDAAQGLPRALFPGILNAIVPAAPGSVDLDIARAVFLRWAWETPDFAASWAVRSPRGPFRREALAEAAGRWRATSPDEAMRWLQTLPHDDRQWIAANEGRFSEPAEAGASAPANGGGGAEP